MNMSIGYLLVCLKIMDERQTVSTLIRRKNSMDTDSVVSDLGLHFLSRPACRNIKAKCSILENKYGC